MIVRRPSGFIEPCQPSKGGPATVRPAVGSRTQARWLPTDGAPGWCAQLLHAQRLRLGGPLPAMERVMEESRSRG
jgi:hypothetical protein